MILWSEQPTDRDVDLALLEIEEADRERERAVQRAMKQQGRPGIFATKRLAAKWVIVWVLLSAIVLYVFIVMWMAL